MINKQNLWFVTLFSLILILGIYYMNIDDNVKDVLKSEENYVKEVIEITESDILVSLEVEKEEERQSLMQEYQNTLLDETSSVAEKNEAYENIESLNNSTTEENKIKNLILEKFKLNSFIKIKNHSIQVVIASNKHDTTLANNIIRSIQELFSEEKYITVKFNC